MNVQTMSGVYENSRIILELLDTDHLTQQLNVIANDDRKLMELVKAVQQLSLHISVMGKIPVCQCGGNLR